MILKMHEITYKTRLGILTALMWTRCWRPSSSCGWPTLACRPASPTTGRPSSPLARGETGFRSRGYSTSPPQPITHRPMVWWSGFTTLWRQPCVPKGGPLPGRITCPGSCWVCVPPPGRRLVCQPQRQPYSSSWWCMVSCHRQVSDQPAWSSLWCHQRSYTTHRAILHPGNLFTSGWSELGLLGKRGTGEADGGKVQWLLQGVGAWQQGVEGPCGREGGHHQQGSAPCRQAWLGWGRPLWHLWLRLWW